MCLFLTTRLLELLSWRNTSCESDREQAIDAQQQNRAPPYHIQNITLTISMLPLMLEIVH